MSNRPSKLTRLGAVLATAAWGCSGPAASSAATLVVSPRGVDSTAGSASAPFRSLKQALLVAKAGARIRLESGTYEQTSGETWGYVPAAGIIIAGDDAAHTLLVGPPPEAGQTLTALTAAASLTLENLSLVGFGVGLNVTSAAPISLSHVIVRDGRTAVRLTSNDGQIEIADSTLSVVESDGAALKLDDGNQRNQILFERDSVTGGVFVADADAALSIEDTTIDGNSSNAAVNFSGATLDITRSQIRAAAAPYGISLRAGALSLGETSVEGGNYAVYQLAGSSKLRKTQLLGYSSIGFYLAKGSVDLGSQTAAGDNALSGRSGSSGAFGIYVDTGTAPVTSSNTSFDGVVPPAGTVQAGAQEIAEPGQYFITPGQSMQFFYVAER